MKYPQSHCRKGKQEESFLKKGLTAFYHQDDEKALELFRKLLRYNPENLHAHYLTALCDLLHTQEQELENICSHALKLNRNHPYTIACEAVRYLYLSNFSRAEALFEKALGILPNDLDLGIGLGILYEFSGDKEKGIDIYTQALRLDPGNPRIHISLGSLYSIDGEFDAALAEYKKAKKFAPDLENPHQHLGCDYYHEGLIEQATSEFGMVIQEEPGGPAAYFYLLDCLRRLGRIDDSLDIYQEIKKKFGNDPSLTSGFFEQFNMHIDAIAALQSLLKKNPNNQNILLRLSRAYLDANRLDEAITMAKRLVQLAPDDFKNLALLGKLYFKSEDYKLAAAFSRRAINLNPNAQSAYTILADSLLFLGQQKKSYGIIQKMELVRKEAWENYQAKFSGQDRADAGL